MVEQFETVEGGEDISGRRSWVGRINFFKAVKRPAWAEFVKATNVVILRVEPLSYKLDTNPEWPLASRYGDFEQYMFNYLNRNDQPIGKNSPTFSSPWGDLTEAFEKLGYTFNKVEDTWALEGKVFRWQSNGGKIYLSQEVYEQRVKEALERGETPPPPPKPTWLELPVEEITDPEKYRFPNPQVRRRGYPQETVTEATKPMDSDQLKRDSSGLRAALSGLPADPLTMSVKLSKIPELESYVDKAATGELISILEQHGILINQAGTLVEAS